MSLFSKVLHHHHVRKRVHEKLEKYPSPDKTKRFLDRVIYFVGVSGPIMTLPQLYEIWINQNTAGVSLISWGWYLATAFVWLTYALVHKEKPLIVTYILWIIIEFFIVLGILIY